MSTKHNEDCMIDDSVFHPELALSKDDVEIGFFRWWSDWIDINFIEYSGMTFLLQMRIGRNNKKQFNLVPVSGNEIGSINFGVNKLKAELVEIPVLNQSDKVILHSDREMSSDISRAIRDAWDNFVYSEKKCMVLPKGIRVSSIIKSDTEGEKK